MNNLKKALTREDPTKYHKSKIQISAFKKNNQWGQVECMMQKKTQKRNSENSIEESFKAIVEGNFGNGQLKDIGKLFKELKDKYKQFHADASVSSENSGGIFKVLRRMLDSEEGALLRKYLSTTIQKLDTYIKEKKIKDKEKCLNQFNKLLSVFKPVKQAKEDNSKPEPVSKLPHSTSATNLRIRLTKEQYQFEDDEPAIKRKKSLDFKNKSKANSYKEAEGVNKLQMFLKQSNLKLVKTKIEYDYSAIFEASKSNIQSRNKTTAFQPKAEKEVMTKATHGKKNQGFVFYRPTIKKA